MAHLEYAFHLDCGQIKVTVPGHMSTYPIAQAWVRHAGAGTDPAQVLDALVELVRRAGGIITETPCGFQCRAPLVD